MESADHGLVNAERSAESAGRDAGRNAEHDAGVFRARNLALAGMMAALLAVFSWMSVPVPFSPVPVTLQTLGVLLAGTLLGPRWGIVSVLVYLGLGLVGLPVYHNGMSGTAGLFGPTGGFLLSFPVAAGLAGLFAARARREGVSRGSSAALLAGGLLLAEAVFYAAGIPWLMAVTGMGLVEALSVGLLPFLPGDALKLAAAFILTRRTRDILEPVLPSPATE